ncbi:MAG: hypothetical protein RBT33_02035, partial [Candidatus Dojkabacteria bacterium]|nr:hypothetical protein [Candidatus Dojkabacteria bacterium]
MGKKELRKRHNSVILKKELINILEFLHIKDILRRKVESNTPLFKETVEIDSTKKAIIVLPNIEWGYRRQRPQHIFSRLAKKNFNIFYLSPLTSSNEYISVIEPNIYEIHLKTRSSGNVLRDFHLDSTNEKDFLESLDRLLGKYIKKDTYLFVEHPVWKNIAFKIHNTKLVYDLMDLYSGFPEAKKELIEAEEELIKRSDLVLTTANNLYEHAIRLNKSVHMVKNGCDFEYFNVLEKNGQLDDLT